MIRTTLLSGALLGVLTLAPAADATTWDVTFTGSGTSEASYHADEWDTTDSEGTSCEQPSFDYTEAATFKWSYRWSHVHLSGRREIHDPSRHQASGTEKVHSSQGDCRQPGGTYDCTYAIKPGFDGSFLYSELVRGRLLFQAHAFMSGRKVHCEGDDLYSAQVVPTPRGSVYSGFVEIIRTLSPADVSGTHTVVKHVALTKKVLAAPLHGSCSGKRCQATECRTNQTAAYDQQCEYTVGWRGVLKLIPHR